VLGSRSEARGPLTLPQRPDGKGNIVLWVGMSLDVENLVAGRTAIETKGLDWLGSPRIFPLRAKLQFG
jgi:hypothetical protein